MPPFAGAPWPPAGARGGDPGAAFAIPAPMPSAAALKAPASVPAATNCLSSYFPPLVYEWIYPSFAPNSLNAR